MDNSSNSGCLGIIARLFGGGSISNQETNPDLHFTEHDALPYRKRDDFLSKAEISFYHVLTRCVQNRVVFPKVRLADIFFVPQLRENYGAQNRIGQKHIDFLVCSTGDLLPLFGVELDDQSHNRSKQRERDAFVEEVFDAAGLPLLRITAAEFYSLEEIRREIDVIMHDEENPGESEATGYETEKPVCPRCGITMVIRTARQGSNAGKEFYGCKNYPKCKETTQA